MASTTLFAPQVSSVQPAFTYSDNSGVVKIYFSLSAYQGDIRNSNICFSIKDSNKTSAYGSDSMIDLDISPTGLLATAPQQEIDGEKRTYISINLAAAAKNGKRIFKNFTTDQYYQVQLYITSHPFDTTSEDGSLFIVKEPIPDREISLSSSITLIRPIEVIKECVFEGAVIAEDGINTIYATTLEELNGFIQYQNNSIEEVIKNYYFVINDKYGNTVYQSEMIYNTLGIKFSAYIYDCPLAEENYTLTIYINTINDFFTHFSVRIAIGYQQELIPNILFLDETLVSIDHSLGSICLELHMQLKHLEQVGSGTLKIQRSDDDNSFSVWKDMIVLPKYLNIETPFKWNDCSIDGGKVYKYRVIFIPNDKRDERIFVSNKELIGVSSLENIYLSNRDMHLVLKYNSAISNLKYVSQESVTNTLGGRYPIIRVNGDTNYRTFNISGTLAFRYDWENLFGWEGKDSKGASLRQWFSDNDKSLYFNLDKMKKLMDSGALELLRSAPETLERKFRDLAIAFLNDRKPKLFRSTTEGEMIVYLSNVTFTPNKQLGRNIYDFSATATEICDFNEKNLKKYNLLYRELYEAQLRYYVLKVKGDINLQSSGITYAGPYVSADELVKCGDTYVPIVYATWFKQEVSDD